MTNQERIQTALAEAGSAGLTGSEAGVKSGVLLNTTRTILHRMSVAGVVARVGARLNDRQQAEVVYALPAQPAA